MRLLAACLIVTVTAALGVGLWVARSGIRPEGDRTAAVPCRAPASTRHAEAGVAQVRAQVSIPPRAFDVRGITQFSGTETHQWMAQYGAMSRDEIWATIETLKRHIDSERERMFVSREQSGLTHVVYAPESIDPAFIAMEVAVDWVLAEVKFIGSNRDTGESEYRVAVVSERDAPALFALEREVQWLLRRLDQAADDSGRAASRYRERRAAVNPR